MKGTERIGPSKPKVIPAIPAYHRRLAQIREEFLASGDGLALVRGRTAAVDQFVLEAYTRHLSGVLAGPPGFCLAALGGYGRQELFPHSDVDLLLLFARQVGQGVTREQIADFLRELGDAGLRLGHSVRSLAECGVLAPQNTEFSIALLDARLLAGDRELFEKLESDTLPRLVQRERTALLRNLTGLAELRHKKFGETIYHLEPDVKESPGGLRDYQLAGWLARLLRADEKALPPRADLPETARREIAAAHDFLVAARGHLHLLAGRDVNTLTFDMQEQVASRGSGGEGSTSAEQWMRQYFRHGRHIYRLAGQCLRQSAAPRSTLSQWFQQRQERFSNADFVVHNGEAFLRNPISAQRDPALWLDLFEFQARHGVELSLETERRLQRQLAELAEWAQSAAAHDLWPRFRRILRLPNAYKALATMHELGLLGALFPEFGLIDSLVIRDLYHKYTVDEHSLLTIKHLHELKPGTKESTEPRDGHLRLRFAELFAELDQPELLLLALLFHDLGKSVQGDHVQASLRLVEPLLARLALEDPQRDLVRFLVENHLLMSATVGTRDFSDPATVRQFAVRVSTSERLKMLCLLTYSDIHSVNPSAMTPWKEEMLWQLYVATHNELTRQLDTDRATPGEASAVFRPEVVEFLEGFPRRYLKTHTPAEILVHFRLAQELSRKPVQFSLTRQHGHYDLLVLTLDHPFLFAAITGTLAAFGMNILKAEAFSNRRGIVLDTFQFVDLYRNLDLNSEESERILKSLEEAILGRADVAKMLQGRLDQPLPGRASYRVETRVRFDNSASSSSTQLEVVTRDRPGLLYLISNVLSAHGCNIEVVLADTQGPKVMDVFYVTRQGGPLEAEWQAAIEAELRRVLE